MVRLYGWFTRSAHETPIGWEDVSLRGCPEESGRYKQMVFHTNSTDWNCLSLADHSGVIDAPMNSPGEGVRRCARRGTAVLGTAGRRTGPLGSRAWRAKAASRRCGRTQTSACPVPFASCHVFCCNWRGMLYSRGITAADRRISLAWVFQNEYPSLSDSFQSMNEKDGCP
jgi:hypothetical protein